MDLLHVLFFSIDCPQLCLTDWARVCLLRELKGLGTQERLEPVTLAKTHLLELHSEQVSGVPGDFGFQDE